MGNDQGRIRSLYRVGVPGNPPIACEDIEHLAFGSGAVRGIALVSAYRELLKHCGGSLPNLRLVSGTSAGALLAIGVAIGLSPDEMDSLLSREFLASMMNHLNFFKKNAKGTPWFDTAALRALLERALALRNYGPDTRLRDLPLEVPLAATNTRTRDVELLGQRTTPDVRVVDAGMASSAMKHIFRAERLLGTEGVCDKFIDGAYGNEMPFLGPIPVKNTLGLYLFDIHTTSKLGRRFFLREGETPEEKEKIDAMKNHIISIDVSRLGPLEWDMTERMFRAVQEDGRRAVETYFSRPSS